MSNKTKKVAKAASKKTWNDTIVLDDFKDDEDYLLVNDTRIVSIGDATSFIKNIKYESKFSESNSNYNVTFTRLVNYKGTDPILVSPFSISRNKDDAICRIAIVMPKESVRQKETVWPNAYIEGYDFNDVDDIDGENIGKSQFELNKIIKQLIANAEQKLKVAKVKPRVRPDYILEDKIQQIVNVSKHDKNVTELKTKLPITRTDRNTWKIDNFYMKASDTKEGNWADDINETPIEVPVSSESRIIAVIGIPIIEITSIVARSWQLRTDDDQAVIDKLRDNRGKYCFELRITGCIVKSVDMSPSKKDKKKRMFERKPNAETTFDDDM
ncbi:unnamed protein product [Sphagnum troendelagicum]